MPSSAANVRQLTRPYEINHFEVRDMKRRQVAREATTLAMHCPRESKMPGRTPRRFPKLNLFLEEQINIPKLKICS